MFAPIHIQCELIDEWALSSTGRVTHIGGWIHVGGGREHIGGWVYEERPGCYGGRVFYMRPRSRCCGDFDTHRTLPQFARIASGPSPNRPSHCSCGSEGSEGDRCDFISASGLLTRWLRAPLASCHETEELPALRRLLQPCNGDSTSARPRTPCGAAACPSGRAAARAPFHSYESDGRRSATLASGTHGVRGDHVPQATGAVLHRPQGLHVDGQSAG